MVVLGMIALAGCSDDAAAVGGAGGGSAAGGSGGGAAGDCDGVACGDDEYCGFDSGCEGPRSCQPQGCGDGVACGCDGENYGTACDALVQTGGLSASGACTPPDGQFICTYEYQIPIYCQLGTEYCKVQPTQSIYMLSCEPEPESCDEIPTDCDCLADPCSENYCGIDETNGSITVLCPLPE